MEADSAREALTLLNSIAPQVHTLPSSQQMRFHLLQAKAQNKAFVEFTTDSIMKTVVAYYDRHGSHNDRLLAHYLLGCVYRDLGEAPRALEYYQDAIEQADTTEKDCDYKTLCCVYSQMADLYHRQLLFSQNIESLNTAYTLSIRVGDTLNAIRIKSHLASAYILRNQLDSAELVLQSVKQQFDHPPYHNEVTLTTSNLIYLYVRQPQYLSKAKALMDDFEGLNWNSTLRSRQYYSYKGRYYEQKGELDSAEYYFRKVLQPNMSYKAKDPAYRGLLNVYTKRNQADSIAKYAFLYCEANDSSIAIKDRELTAKMAAQYNYDRAQRVAEQQKAKAKRLHRIVWMFIGLAAFLICSIVAVWHFYNKRQRTFYETLEAYHQKVNQLHLLENAHKKVIELVCEDLKISQGESDRYRKKYEETQLKINEINALHDQNILLMKEEISSMKSRIEELQRKLGIAGSHHKTEDFMNSEIVRWISYQVKHQKFEMSEYDKTILQKEFAKSYPTLIDDLHTAGIKENGIIVCILLTLKLREKDISNLLHLSDTGVSNLKSEINLALFNVKSSRSLYKNLESRYGLFL